MKIKKVLITGCSSGFGKLLVSTCLEKGWKVLATMRNADTRKNLFQAESQKYGERLVILNLDVSSSEDLAKVSRYISDSENSELDCLINNAGFGVFSALEDASPEQIRNQMDINVTGLMLTTQEMLKYLRPSKGHIINFSSVLGFSVLPLTSLYCGSKYAVEGFSESLHYELAPHGVRVSIVEPGAYATDFKQNVIYGDLSGSDASPYFRQSQNYKKFSNDFSGGGRPQVVVDKVIAAILKKHPPLRIRCGKDAVFVYLAQRLVPGPIYRALNSLLFKLTINKL